MKWKWLAWGQRRNIERRCSELATWMINWSGVEDYCRNTFRFLREARCLCEELWDIKVRLNIRFTCSPNINFSTNRYSRCRNHFAECKNGRGLQHFWSSVTPIWKHQSEASITLTSAVSPLFFFFYCRDKPLRVAKNNLITNTFIRLQECKTQGEPMTAFIRWC